MALLRIHCNQPWIVCATVDLPDAPENDGRPDWTAQRGDDFTTFAVFRVGFAIDFDREIPSPDIGFQLLPVVASISVGIALTEFDKIKNLGGDAQGHKAPIGGK
jgi:hypothetical protein